MCGIAGEFSFTGKATARPLDSLRHRGPDGSGNWISPKGNCWLGHTRLAIMDPSPTGAQPMVDPENGNVVVFNGEIYNHFELRRELEMSHAIQWRGTSDTETLLKGYSVWGSQLPSKLRGMFAFAIFSPHRESLFLARDPFGIKPLYALLNANGIRFASEWRFPGLAPNTFSPSDLSSFLAWGATGEREPGADGVRAVGPGCSMEFDLSGQARASRYWPGPRIAPRGGSDPVALVRAGVEKAVRENLLADVPVAVCLSGGIDSSVITAVAARALGGPLRTFSVGFADKEFDETAIAEEVSKAFGTTHTRLALTESEILPMVCEAVRKLDLPSVDAINSYIVCRAIAGHGVKVALSGLGSDEIFGGYPSFESGPRLGWVANLPAFAKGMLALLGRRGARLAQMPRGAVNQALWRRRFWFDADLKLAGLPPLEAEPWFTPEFPDDFAAISWAEMRGYMSRMLLRDADQMSMASSVELRVPFLDVDLVELVLGLPAKIKRGYGRPKGLLIEAFKDLLPRNVYDRPKMGFSLPMAEWIRGPLREFVAQGLEGLAEARCLEGRFVDSTRARFESGRLHWTRYWGLVVLGHYLSRDRT